MSNHIPEKLLLELLKETEEKGNLKIDVLPIPNNIEEDVINISVVDYEDLIHDQSSLELLLLLYSKLDSYSFVPNPRLMISSLVSELSKIAIYPLSVWSVLKLSIVYSPSSSQ